MKKKIAFVIESIHLGGAEKSLVTLLQNLDYTKYDVDLITFQSDGFFKDFVPANVNHVVIQMPQLSVLDRIRFKLKRCFLKSKHHAQLFWPIVSKYFEKCNNEYAIAIAYNQGFATYYVHDFIDAAKKYSWLNIDYEKARYNIKFDYSFYQNFDKIIAVSDEAKRGLENQLRIISKYLSICIIKDITDSNIITQQSLIDSGFVFKPDAINLVTVCRLAKQKGLFFVVEVASVLIKMGYPINWYIIGEGVERRFLEKEINRLGLNDVVFLLGATSNPYSFMRAADIYVQTSLFEGLGLTVIEAACLNKPIVCTNFPTAYNILKHEETGLICEMNTIAIASSIRKLIENDELKKKFTLNLSKQENRDKETTLNLIDILFQ